MYPLRSPTSFGAASAPNTAPPTSPISDRAPVTKPRRMPVIAVSATIPTAIQSAVFTPEVCRRRTSARRAAATIRERSGA